MKLGNTLRTIRNNSGYSMRDLAILSKTSKETIARIEKDQVSVSLNTLERILKVLKVKVSEFFKTVEDAKNSSKNSSSKS